MTIRQLHNLTGKLIAEGHSRKPVCIDKTTFSHPLEPDGCCILEVESAEVKCHEMLDENGSSEKADGGTRQRTSFVLSGELGV